MKTASAKAKGRRFQQEITQKIAELLNLPWGPDELIASREMGQQGVDVRLIGDALKQFPYSIEAKSQQTWAIPQWIEQAEANLIPNTNWLLICKRSQKKGVKQRKIVVLDYDHFFNLIQSILPNAVDNENGQ